MWDQDIICPYCGHVEDDENLDIDELKSGRHERHCLNCNKNFILNVKFEPVFNTEIKES